METEDKVRAEQDRREWRDVAKKFFSVLLDVRLLGSVLTLLTAIVVYKTSTTSTKVDESVAKQQKTAVVDSSFKKKSEGRWMKVDSNFSVVNARIDSINKKQDLILQTLKTRL